MIPLRAWVSPSKRANCREHLATKIRKDPVKQSVPHGLDLQEKNNAIQKRRQMFSNAKKMCPAQQITERSVFFTPLMFLLSLSFAEFPIFSFKICTSTLWRKFFPGCRAGTNSNCLSLTKGSDGRRYLWQNTCTSERRLTSFKDLTDKALITWTCLR